MRASSRCEDTSTRSTTSQSGDAGGVPTLWQWTKGYVRKVHLDVRRYAMDALPENEEALSGWLVKRFEEKDRRLDSFYSNESFRRTWAHSRRKYLSHRIWVIQDHQEGEMLRRINNKFDELRVRIPIPHRVFLQPQETPKGIRNEEEKLLF